MVNAIYSNDLGIGGILTEAKNLFFDNISTYMKIFLILMLPLAVVQVIAGYLPLVLTILLFIVAIVASIIGSIALIKQTDKFISGDKKFDFEALRKESGTYFWKYLGLAIIMGVLLVFLFMLFIIPGIIFSVFWAFAMTALIIKNISPVEALKYSKKLVKGRWWNVLGYLFVFGLFALVLMIPFFLISLFALLGPVIATLATIIYLIGTYMVSLYFVVVQVVYFKNMDLMYGENTSTAQQSKTVGTSRVNTRSKKK